MKRTVYADNAATTQLDMDAFEAMRPYLLSEYGNACERKDNVKEYLHTVSDSARQCPTLHCNWRCFL